MKRSLIFQFVLFQFLFPLYASAQLSPGDLHEAHSHLEGLKNCETCHEAGRQILPAKCLECHSLLRERIDSDKGLHSNEGYDDCVVCHVEHLGRDVELIWWPDEIYNFDHNQTGYKLAGKHAVLKCGKCHTEKNIKDIDRLLSANKNPNRSFFGLNVGCLNCHDDRHAGQLDKIVKNVIQQKHGNRHQNLITQRLHLLFPENMESWIALNATNLFLIIKRPN